MNTLKNILYVVVFILISMSCTEKEPEPKGHPNTLQKLSSGIRKELRRLKDENSWLTLVGLHWLKEGENSFGSDKNNDIVFPENAPQNIGKIVLKTPLLHYRVDEGVNVINEGKLIKEIKLEEDLTGNPTVLDVGSLRWYIIKRAIDMG